MSAAMAPFATEHDRYKRPRRRRWAAWWLGGLIGLEAGPTLAADAFDGTYSGRRVLTKGSTPQCVPSEDVSVTIQGGALTFSDSALRNFSIGFDPHPDGSFGLISSAINGASVLIQGRIAGNVLDADVSNGPCDHHWHLTKKSSDAHRPHRPPPQAIA
jgi:hypothetical protein